MFHYLDTTALHARALARVGSTVRGKYTLLEVLGTGGMASVFRARHRAGQEVALKIVHPALEERVAAADWLLREAMLTNAVSHPGVARVLDDDRDDAGSPMLVLDLLRGESLATHVHRLGGRLPAGRALEIADGVLDILDAVHARGVVHCDIKPDNLLVTERGVALLDFGIARARGLELPPLPAVIANEPMGTPDFMPPEQAAGRWDWVDGRTDLYALGATLYVVLSGRYVRDGVSMKDQLEAARLQRVPPLGAVAPSIRSVLSVVVDRALAFDPDARHPSAIAMREAVRAAREQYTANAEQELANRHKLASGAYPSALAQLPTLGRVAS